MNEPYVFQFLFRLLMDYCKCLLFKKIPNLLKCLETVFNPSNC